MKTPKRSRQICWAIVVSLFGCAIEPASGQSPPRTGSQKSEPPSAAPAVVQNQSAGPTGAKANPRKTFSDMSVSERNRILDEIRKKDLVSFFHTWIESGQSDPTMQQTIGFIFAGALREKPPDREVFEQMRRFISDSSNPGGDRSQLIGVLGSAKTKDALDLLLQLALTLPDKEFQRIVFRSIRSAGGMWEDGTFHAELSPALERVWRESQNPELVASVAFAMAKVGAPSGVELLMSSALAPGPQDDFRASAAREALAEMLNSDAVPTLSARLANDTPTDTASILASSTLLAIGDEIASKAILNWLQNADESAAPLAHDFVARTRTPAQLEAWESALNPAVRFRSEKNREAVRVGLAEFHKSRQ